MSDDFEKALEEYIEEVTKITTEYFSKQLQNLTPPTFTVERGQKWIRVVKNYYGNQRSVHSFVALVDVKTKNLTAKRGDIMKAASWKIPAKHPRGSIFANKGRDSMGELGFVNYLK